MAIAYPCVDYLADIHQRTIFSVNGGYEPVNARMDENVMRAFQPAAPASALDGREQEPVVTVEAKSRFA